MDVECIRFELSILSMLRAFDFFVAFIVIGRLKVERAEPLIGKTRLGHADFVTICDLFIHIFYS